MFKYILLIIGIALLSLDTPASTTSGDQGRVKMLMHTFVIELSRMSPFLNDEKAFTSPEGKERIKSSLTNLDKRVQNPPPELNQSTGFRITFGLLADHISKTRVMFEKGQYEYSRIRLLGMTNLCASCHTQTPTPSRNSPFADFITADSKPGLENSNFLFVIRRYDEALANFDKLVRNYPKSGLSSDQIMDIYRKKLAIFARIKRDPDAAIANLTEDLKNQSLPVDARQNAQDWIANFKKWKDEAKDPSTFSTPELIAFVASKIPPRLDRKIAPSDPQLMNLLRLSGLLYERLYKVDDPKSSQELLYYLAMCERSLSPVNWYSLNEIYLKECVVRFPKSALTKKCFDGYQAGMEERFLGGAMPEAIRGSIDALKGHL